MSLGTNVVDTKYVSAAPVVNVITPFLVDQPVKYFSTAGTTIYGANHPGSGSTTKYARFYQSVTGNKAFSTPTANTAPLQTSGAVAAADQLRSIVLTYAALNAVPTIVKHSDDSAVAAASSFCIGVGGGTAVADATLIVKGTTAANILAGATSLSIASTGADTQTILVGDIITIAGDATTYRATATTASLNGTTEVLLAITPPLQATTVAGTVITCATSDDRTVLFATAPAVGTYVEVLTLAAADITTISGGALTAGRDYVASCFSFMHSAGNVSVTRIH